MAGRLWAVQQNGIWTRFAPEFNRWDIYSEPRLDIAADPTSGSACYFVNPDGSVQWRNVDLNQNKEFPGIKAKAVSVGGGRLWAIQQNGIWTRYAPEFNRWDIYSEARLAICADPTSGSACYYIDPDGSVHWRDVDKNVNKDFPGIKAKAISAGGGRLWAIQQNGIWTRYAPEFNRWDIYSEPRLDISADSTTGSACYFVNPDGSVQYRNVDQNQNKEFPGIKAKMVSFGGV